MFMADWAGAALTIFAMALLGAGGYLGALLALREEAARDRLLLGVATLLIATAQAIFVATLLGAGSFLRLGPALGLQLATVAVLFVRARRLGFAGGPAGPARELAAACWRRAAEHPALALVAVHAVGSEALRGLLRPPLAWDSLMYHLLLTGTWLRDGNLMPVLGNIPVNYYGYVPANGSLWWWWWMAPSHSELYVNLGALPHWLLLGLATGALARRLGAVQAWPMAAVLTLLTPAVVRFVATQYVDILVGGLILAGLVFALRWVDRPRWGDALLTASAFGLAAGTKVLGAVYAVFLTLLAVPLARGGWRRRLAQAVPALLVAMLLGSFFYARNLALGVDPLAMHCEATSGGHDSGPRGVPRPDSVAGLGVPLLVDGQILDAFLGVVRPQWLELGIGPAAPLLLVVLLLAPWAVPAERRREGIVLLAFAALALAFWVVVPFAGSRHLFGNVRYLVPVIGAAFALLVAGLERRPGSQRWLPWLALALAIQSLLQLHAEMPRGVRVVVLVVDLAVAALAVSPRLRGVAVRRWVPLAATVAAALLLLVPAWSRFRAADRGRAFATELTAHRTTTRLHAAAWQWLDLHAGAGNVAVMGTPKTFFAYPAMGPRLERDVRFVNVNAADLAHAAAYPNCQPRVDLDRNSWVRALLRQRIRWLHLMRFPEFAFPIEDRWARELPRLFVPRYRDETNAIYEVVWPPGLAGAPAASAAP
jgi:hypothetical protein